MKKHPKPESKPEPEPETEAIELSETAGETEEVAEEETPAAEAPPAEPAKDPLKKLQAERNALRDQLIRRQADFENFRKRTEREVAEFKQLAAAELAEALLPVLDGFERALNVAGGSSLDDYKKGLELIYKQFYDTLMRFGLTPVKAAGHPFNPHYHYAVERVESEEHKDQTVIEELQRGYTFKHKLLRPAMVRVAVHPAAEPAVASEPESQTAADEGSEENKKED